MLRLAFLNLFRHKVRTLITLVSIAFGVAALILAGGFVEDIFIQLRDATIHSRTGYLQLYRAGYFEFGRREPYDYLIDSAPALVPKLVKQRDTVDVLQRLNFTGLLNNSKVDRSIIAEGVEPDKEARLGSFISIIAGEQLKDSDENGMLIGEGVAKSLQLAPGDFANLVATTTDGSMNTLEVRIVGVFRSFSKDFDARAVRVPLTTAQELLNTQAVHSLVFSLHDVTATDRVAAWLKRGLPAKKYEIKTWLELDDFYQKTVALYDRQFGVLQVIILGIVLLSVANSVSMTANERVGEFGTLRAVGHTSGYVYQLLLVENTILGVLGASIGLGLGVGLALLISKIGIPMPPPPNANAGYTALIRVLPMTCVVAFVIGFAATVMSAVLVCRGPTRRPIAEALRQNI